MEKFSDGTMFYRLSYHSAQSLRSSSPMEKFSDGTLCYRCYDKPYVYFVDKSWHMYKNIKLDVNVCDIAIHPTTDLLYCVCFSDNSIRTVDIHTGTTSILFTTVDKPYCMAFTGDGTIFVGFYITCKVVNYTMSGQVIKSFDVENPWNIFVSDITGNIVIAARGVLVVNKDYPDFPKEMPQSKKILVCYDAVFDTEGHILVDDYDNKEVHVVENTHEL